MRAQPEGAGAVGWPPENCKCKVSQPVKARFGESIKHISRSFNLMTKPSPRSVIRTCAPAVAMRAGRRRASMAGQRWAHFLCVNLK